MESKFFSDTAIHARPTQVISCCKAEHWRLSQMKERPKDKEQGYQSPQTRTVLLEMCHHHPTLKPHP